MKNNNISKLILFNKTVWKLTKTHVIMMNLLIILQIHSVIIASIDNQFMHTSMCVHMHAFLNFVQAKVFAKKTSKSPRPFEIGNSKRGS